MYRHHGRRENSKHGTGYRCSSILNASQYLPTEVFTYPHEKDKNSVKDLHRRANMHQGGVASQSEEGRQRVDITLIGGGRRGTTFNRAELVGKYWNMIKTVQYKEENKRASRLKLLMERYPNLQREELGVFKGTKAKLNIKEGCTPVFLKARPVPYSLRAKVDAEIERLQKEGIITPIEWSEWVTPIVVVPKPDGTIRL